MTLGSFPGHNSRSRQISVETEHFCHLQKDYSMESGSADDRTRNGRNSVRQKYIVRAVVAYAGFSLAWIFLSDMLLSALVDVQSIQWLSTAKGFLYVLVTALMLFLMMRAIPDESSGNDQAALLHSIFAGSGKLRLFMYVFAVLVSLAMLLVRDLLAVPFGLRPLLILFMFPVILSAVVGGLGPGLVATAVSTLGLCYYAIPPTRSILIEHPYDLFQLAFFVGNGVLVSILSNVLHRLRRQSDEEKQLQEVTLASIGDGVIATDVDNRVTFINSEALRMTGWNRQDALGKPLAAVFQVIDDQARPDEESRFDCDALAGGAGVENKQGMLRSRDGREIPINRSNAGIRLADGTHLGQVLVIRDETARRKAEAVLQESEETYRSLFTNMLNSVAHCRMVYRDGVPVDYEYIAVNPAFEKSTGLHGVVGKRIGDFIANYSEQNREMLEVFDRVATTGEPIRWEHYQPTFDAWYSLAVYSPNRGEFIAVSDDISERKRAERALLDEYERRRVMTDNSRDGIVIIDQEYKVYEANRRFVEMLGYSAGEVVGLFVRDFDELFAEQHIWENLADLASTGMVFETRHRRKDGSTFAVEVSISATHWAGQQLVFCVCRDITERKQAEEENRKLEVQLVHAQKMEAVGRLAGGVAHDFNNMLSVILGHAEIALSQTAREDSRYEDLQEIQKAATRSASLTRQLLAFARKQTVSPKVLDLNETVVSMLKMLRRLIGEDIDLLWLPGHELHNVKIDPSQIDQMLANLAVNARDAIAGVGRVTIATANISLSEEDCRNRQTVAPGDYVVLTVSDSGAGMSQEVLDHIFEPFYTTKDVGKGTGLGLSTVFGIVKQNNGFVEVSSEAGAGTVFRIYLPMCPVETAARQEGKEPEKPPRGHETVLIVEDEPAILSLGNTILQRLGYTVLTSATPNAAFQMVVDNKDAIELLITDVVMPEMNGRDLLEWLSTIKPGLKCLYMSGYTANAIAHHGVLDEGVRFLQKPFSVLELATQVRRAIDES
jgi:PAS domain S-box-containing protein